MRQTIHKKEKKEKQESTAVRTGKQSKQGIKKMIKNSKIWALINIIHSWGGGKKRKKKEGKKLISFYLWEESLEYSLVIKNDGSDTKRSGDATR